MIIDNMQTVADPMATSFIMQMMEQYGVTGGAFAVLLWLMIRYNKDAQRRIEELEGHQREQHNAHLGAHKEMVDQYVDLVRNKTKVLADLTGCLKAMKDTMERLERKQDDLK